MILEDLRLSTTQNLVTDFIDPDTPQHCVDRKYFDQYPYAITYCYNSRGFRDQEWPQDLSQAVWCFGDSFTVGIGSPREHTWPWLLQQSLDQRTVNVSLHGASNNWMTRRALQIIQTVNPQRCVFHWSYLHRREKDERLARNELWTVFYNNIKDPSWPDCDHYWDLDKLPTKIQREIIQDFEWTWQTVYDDQRRLHFCTTTLEQDMINTLDCIDQVARAAPNSIHSFIPGFCDSVSKKAFELQLGSRPISWIAEQPIQDWARDHIHYDKVTAQALVTSILEHW